MAIASAGTATGASDISAGGQTLTWSFTNTAATNLMVVAGGKGTANGEGTISSVTYAGSATGWEERWEDSDESWVTGGCWTNVNGSLPTGANDVTITFANGTATQLAGIACAFVGDGALSLGATATPTTSDTGTTPSVTMSSDTGRLVVGAIFTDGNEITGRTGTLPSGTAEISNIGSDVAIGVQYYAGAASVTAQWTTSGSNGGVCGAFEIIETGGGGRTTKNTRGYTLGVNVGMGHRMPV